MEVRSPAHSAPPLVALRLTRAAAQGKAIVLLVVRKHLHQFDERLTRRFAGEARELAEHILDAVTASADEVRASGIRRSAREDSVDVDRVLAKLESQDFLVRGENGDSLRFPFQILRRWRMARGAR